MFLIFHPNIISWGNAFCVQELKFNQFKWRPSKNTPDLRTLSQKQGGVRSISQILSYLELGHGEGVKPYTIFPNLNIESATVDDFYLPIIGNNHKVKLPALQQIFCAMASRIYI